MVFASVRDGIADYVSGILVVYLILIFGSILITYLPRVPYNRGLRAVLDFITEVTNPVLEFLRRYVPMVRLGGMGLDLSPTIAIIVLLVLMNVVPPLIAG